MYFSDKFTAVPTLFVPIEFHKKPIPDDPEGKIDLTETLSKLGISLPQYRNAMQLQEIGCLYKI